MSLEFVKRGFDLPALMGLTLVTVACVFPACGRDAQAMTPGTLEHTTLAYAIAVPETLYAAAAIWSEELNVREMMNVVLIVYLLLIALLVLALKGWERALHVPGFGHQS